MRVKQSGFLLSRRFVLLAGGASFNISFDVFELRWPPIMTVYEFIGFVLQDVWLLAHHGCCLVVVLVASYLVVCRLDVHCREVYLLL